MLETHAGVSTIPAKPMGVHAEGKTLGRLKAIVAAAVVDVVGGLLGRDGEPGGKVDHAGCEWLRLTGQAEQHA